MRTRIGAVALGGRGLGGTGREGRLAHAGRVAVHGRCVADTLQRVTEAIERTLILVKPDGVARGLCGEVLRRVEAKG